MIFSYLYGNQKNNDSAKKRQTFPHCVGGKNTVIICNVQRNSCHATYCRCRDKGQQRSRGATVFVKVKKKVEHPKECFLNKQRF